MPALYRDIVLDHHRAPRHHGALDDPSHASDGVNALCGDSLRIELRVSEARIVEYRFRGECCAIATATASLLGQAVQGRAVAEIAPLQQAFAALVAGGEPALPLGDLSALSELARYPARRKCALLPWATLLAALRGDARTTTEKDDPA
ncbi:MAG TPA: SUF system NifU family Fe-S cluster assembly protein [Tahibacter sp.]|uniref:Fe-S cluster assembly sulfur transfer protein SufU n=1 Tax=Tahibacter sp. TaxID=2056211 RepID=UPI002BB1D8CA|nr:SUF system NifU family Fe-S cluster assembly protein [Tahibacter sp.]HSX61144.1 SUF system NifU family Fe-S cluster assembly protein [Tahibacter sp.]